MKGWYPWKLTMVAVLPVLATALLTGIVVANWTGGERTAAGPRAAGRAVGAPAPAAPTRGVVDACNRYASTLYGLDGNRKHDERYREAYTGCLRSLGYTG
jgi:hypothetical protein